MPRNAGELLVRFVSAFKRGIEGELVAMRESAETFELALVRGEELGGLRYSFEVATSDRLVAGSVAVLKSPSGEQRVVVERVADDRIVLLADQAIDVAAPCALVIAPWFLYDRLIAALDAISAAPLALMLFGKQPPARVASALRLDHGELDPSQRAAVQLCADSELAFVWGPPGTGKTATLVHVIDELLAKGERILVASTTNAAIDQLLAKLAARPGFAPGVFVRLGRSDADTFGAELADIVDARQSAQRDRLAKLRSRIGEVEQQLRYAGALAGELAPALTMQQSLFAEPPPKLRAGALSRVFAAADAIAAQGAREQLRAVEARIARLDRVRELAKLRVRELGAEARGVEARVVAAARVVMCTLTASYVSPLLAPERFDALIAEEAGMATLPPLFYAASRCDRRAIMVGDPRQLPPIVQSNDDAVRRAIGRNIFDVTVPDPAASSIVAMLEVQYRMHPAIGALVGSLFYADRLVHRAASDVAEIAARAPFAGRAVVVDDVASTCERSAKGSSRVNAISAARIADRALEAVRGGSRSIGVITPYAAQASEIRRLLAARGIADAVECSTIHRFQGRECDVVLIDLVDAQPMRPSALVADAPNLLNVSISRARGKLVIVADVAYWNAAAPHGLVAAMLHRAMRA
ncbi:MAG TPA: AAA domain-containing protein [Kofleriaceae bacterium]|nr:AAA domain-containing protein [Kofleriaceae bacterium]